nr:replication protein A 70 kDa DNA-binding subunit B-like [Ipomoea batatas]
MKVRMSEALKKPTSQTWTAMCAALSELGRQLLVVVHYFIGSFLELQNHHHGARTLDYGEVRISSSFNATKLWFNHKCPQFSAFVESLPSMCTPIRRIDSSSRLSIVKKDFVSSSSKIEITTLQHVYARQEAVDFWIAGKILGVESLEEWYYVSCKRIGCNKKLETQNGQLYCKKCNRNWREGSISYKVVLRVQDNTMDAPLLVSGIVEIGMPEWGVGNGPVVYGLGYGLSYGLNH